MIKMSKIDISVVHKFDGKNYQQWRFHIKCALRAMGVFEVVDGSLPKPTENRAEEVKQWNQKDAMAMFTLTSAMKIGQITLVMKCASSKEILDKLDTIYLQNTESHETGGGGTGESGYMKTMNLSPELAALVGQSTMARHEVVKIIWSIIKERDLYDPKNKQYAICDDALFKVFGVKRFRTFGMMKFLKGHFIS